MPHSSKGCWELISAAASSVSRKRQDKTFKIQAFRDKPCRDYIKQFITIYKAIYLFKSCLLISFSERKFDIKCFSCHEGCDPVHHEKRTFVLLCSRHQSDTKKSTLNRVNLRLTSGRRGKSKSSGQYTSPV